LWGLAVYLYHLLLGGSKLLTPAVKIRMSRLRKFELRGNKSTDTVPDHCYYCGGLSIVGIEIIGALEEILIWQCDDCHEYMLRFDEKTTEKYLNRAPTIDITEDEWDNIWQGQPN